MTILPVTLDNTFDQWRIKTNQLIIQAEQIDANATAAFQKANAANLFAYNISISANLYSNSVGAAANGYTDMLYTNSLMHANSVGLSSNARADAIGLASNNFASVATNLTSGTVPSARLSGSYTGITGLGTITTGRWNGSAIGVTFGGTGGTTQATARAGLGLGTASTFNIGTSGATIGRLDSENTWSGLQSFVNGFYIDGAALTVRGSYLRTSGSFRWIAGADNVAETGSNAGSNYAIYRYADNGTLLDTPLTISRSTGRTLLQSLNLTNDLAISDGGTGASDAAGARTNLGLGSLATQNSVNGTQIIVGSDAQGDILYRGATAWERLPAGTSGQVLKTGGAGANPSWSTPITIGTPVSVGAGVGNTVTITGISAGVKRITVIFTNVSTNGINDYQLRIGDSEGLETTGYAGSSGTGAATAFFSSSFVVHSNPTNTANAAHSGIVTLINPSGTTWIISGAMAANVTTSPSFCAGSKTLSGTLDRINFFVASGNSFDGSGTITIAYE